MSQQSPVRVQLPSGQFKDALPSSFRYDLLLKIASGGMATVYVGGLSGAQGFRRIVAIKRAHPHLLEDPIFKSMLVAEAKMASLVRHPNVIGVHDVEETEGELLLVMEYIEGASLAQVIMAGTAASAIDAPIAMRIVRDACEGLHAIHLLRDDDGNPLGLVHRDISPQNILVGIDGMARVADFGIAKASAPQWAAQHTATGALRGKAGYMAPEYVETCNCDPQSDVFSLGVVAWEALTRRRLFKGSSDIETIKMIRSLVIPPPSSLVPELPAALDEVILKSLARDPADRWPTARAFGEGLEDALRKSNMVASHGAVEERMFTLFGEAMAARRAAIRSLMAVPQGRPVTMSEVLKVAQPVDGTPATSLSSAKEPKSSPNVALDVREESSASGASLDVPPQRKPKRLLALSSAALGVVVVALGMVAIGIAQSGPKVAAASAAVASAAPTVAPLESNSVAATTPPAPVAIESADSKSADSSKKNSSSKSTKRSATGPRIVTAPSAIATPPAPTPTATATTKVEPVITSNVPKNPYAP
jgi:serine/threonine-protein kinase